MSVATHLVAIYPSQRQKTEPSRLTCDLLDIAPCRVYPFHYSTPPSPRLRRARPSLTLTLSGLYIVSVALVLELLMQPGGMLSLTMLYGVRTFLPTSLKLRRARPVWWFTNLWALPDEALAKSGELMFASGFLGVYPM